MGMSSSQWRLLSLTARMHDIEFAAQALQAQKIQLATQEDEVYQKYCDALDAKKITVAYINDDGGTKYVDANYSTVCGFNENRIKQYALRDNRTGHLMVTEKVKSTYEDYENDPYCFAWAMMGFEGNFNWASDQFTNTSETGIFVGVGIGQSCSDYDGYIQNEWGEDLPMTQCEQLVFDEFAETDSKLQEKYDTYLSAETESDARKALNDFRKYLYNSTAADGQKYSSKIFNYMVLNKNDEYGVSEERDPEFEGLGWSGIEKEFQYYVQLFNSIKEAGGCEVIDPQYTAGDDGTNWFNNMVKSGLVTIQVLKNEGTSNARLVDTSVATSINENYLQEADNDKNLAKIQAEYEHDLKVINMKDTKIDTELKNLETERTALTTSMDSIKKAKDDNIDRTFGIFS